jgi:tight adherence protein B
MMGVATATPVIVREALVGAAVPWPVDRCWLVWRVAVGAAAAIGLLAGGPAAGVVLAAAAAVGPVILLLTRRGRRAALADAALPDALDAMARALRGGASLGQAVDDAAGSAPAPLADDLASVAAGAQAGIPLVTALDDWADRAPRPAVRMVVAALALASEAGGGPARAIDGVAASLRAELAVRAELRALSSQARYSALVIGLAPVAFGGVAAVIDGHTAGFLLRTRAGLVCLTAGLALDAVGGWWMHRIVVA